MFILVDVRYKPYKQIGLPSHDVRHIQQLRTKLIKQGYKRDTLQVRTQEGYRNVPILMRNIINNN